PDLRFVTRTFNEKTKRMRSAIDVDAIREVTRALRLAPAWGGRRLVIIDPAEDMNRASQNALLKTLEEPPDGAVLLLISHAPGRLAPTVRSRCRRLDLRPLPEEEVSAFLLAEGHARNEAEASQLAVISKGSPGRAIALAAAGGAEIEGKLVRFLASAVRGDWSAADLKLADEFARPASETAFRVFFELMFDRLAATARAAATGDATGNAAPEPFSGPLGAPHRWAEAWARTREIFDDALAVNLDRKLAILSAGAEVGAAARAG
ncbi:MAG: DNA polymerase III subunit delta', partial [Pseudomonadota bacterium]